MKKRKSGVSRQRVGDETWQGWGTGRPPDGVIFEQGSEGSEQPLWLQEAPAAGAGKTPVASGLPSAPGVGRQRDAPVEESQLLLAPAP